MTAANAEKLEQSLENLLSANLVSRCVSLFWYGCRNFGLRQCGGEYLDVPEVRINTQGVVALHGCAQLHFTIGGVVTLSLTGTTAFRLQRRTAKPCSCD